MMSDVPFGVFLSGGVDSSTNVALMSELMDDPVRTFSVGFERARALQRAASTRAQIAQRYGTDHHEVVIDWDDLEAFLPELIHHQDEPIADWVCVPLYYVSKLARDNGTIVVQIGEGSDELFHGYQSYISHAALHRALLGAVPARAAALIRRADRPRCHVARVQLGRASSRTRRRSRTPPPGGMPFWGGAIA